MKKILIVEDNASHRQMLRELLENENYEVLEAVDGEQGLALYEMMPCDLVITDIYMPVKSGNDMIEALMKTYPNVKIIAASGKGFMKGEHLLHIAETLGVKKTFRKPIKISQLLSAVEAILNEPN